jgi:hypothetical protein
MFLATINKNKHLVYICYIGKVTMMDLQRGAVDVEKLLTEFEPGFRLLADFSRLDSMDMACVPEIGRMMELLERHQVGLIVRVVPDEDKDIGFNIISAFHYKKRPQSATFKTMKEAAKLLTL